MKNIICAYDFSPTAINALKHSVRLASRFGSVLHLLYIYNVPVPVTEFGYIDVGDEVLRSNADKELNKLKESLLLEHDGLSQIEVHVESGLVVHKVNKLAGKLEADLVVMGIESEAGFIKEHLFGSSSLDESRESQTPILIVPGKAPSNKITKIAFACDYKNVNAQSTSLIQVKYYATLFDAELYLVHVLEPEHQLNLAEAKTNLYIEQSLEQTEHKTYFVYEKDAAKGIIDFVENHGVDLLITEPRKKSFWERIFGKSVTKQLAFHLPLPLLAIDGGGKE